MSQILTLKDFDTICRICLSSKDPAILFWNMEIIHMLETCTSVQESMEEKFPKHICTTCHNQLKISFEFKQQYMISLQILTNIVLKSESNKSESIKNETDDDEMKYDISETYLTLPLEVNIIKTEEKIEEKPDDKILRKKLSNTINEKKTTENSSDNDNDFLNDEDDVDSTSSDSNCSENIEPEQISDKRKIRRKRSTNLENSVDEQTEWICDICGRKFSKKVYMKKHQVLHSDARPFECYICHKTFKLKWSMKEHVKTQHTERDKRVMCPICGQLILPKSVTYHKNKHKENKEKFKCQLCDKEYTQKSGLQMHINEKHSDNVKIYYCDICSKGFVAKGSLRIHKKFTHTKEKNQTCPICGKSYKKVSDVNAHINAVHKNLKPHACTICSKAFYSKSLLNKHMICHTGERPFTCTICGKSFGFKSVLTTHMKVHSK